MIEIKLNKLVDNSETLRGVLEKELRGRAAFQLARLIREIDRELNTFFDSRNKIINKYCEKDENGNAINRDGNVSIQQDYIKEFNQELSELLNMNITLNIEPIQLEDVENANFTVQQMLALEPFIRE